MRFCDGSGSGRTDDDNLVMGVCIVDLDSVFYAIRIGLTLVGEVDELTMMITWAYVGIRIAHSLLQMSSNRLLPRFLLFAGLFAVSVSPP